MRHGDGLRADQCAQRVVARHSRRPLQSCRNRGELATSTARRKPSTSLSTSYGSPSLGTTIAGGSAGSAERSRTVPLESGFKSTTLIAKLSCLFRIAHPEHEVGRAPNSTPASCGTWRSSARPAPRGQRLGSRNPRRPKDGRRDSRRRPKGRHAGGCRSRAGVRQARGPRASRSRGLPYVPAHMNHPSRVDRRPVDEANPARGCSVEEDFRDLRVTPDD